MDDPLLKDISKDKLKKHLCYLLSNRDVEIFVHSLIYNQKNHYDDSAKKTINIKDRSTAFILNKFASTNYKNLWRLAWNIKYLLSNTVETPEEVHGILLFNFSKLIEGKVKRFNNAIIEIIKTDGLTGAHKYFWKSLKFNTINQIRKCNHTQMKFEARTGTNRLNLRNLSQNMERAYFKPGVVNRGYEVKNIKIRERKAIVTKKAIDSVVSIYQGDKEQDLVEANKELENISKIRHLLEKVNNFEEELNSK
ncbi:hypothetical protein [Mycoplasma sp. 005V]|uniref:hypothetical protein n=1 Tax=unclassified Mycoplasma TaxID=2683645 RepID=UPI003A858C86